MNPILRRFVIAVCLLAAVLLVGFWLYSRKAKSARTDDRTAAAPSAGVPPAPAPQGPNSTPATPSATAGTTEKIEDYRAALEAARALRDPRLRSREFSRILRLWVERDLDAALAYLRQLPVTSSDYTQGVLLLLEAVGQTDPVRALTLARELAVTRDQLAIYSSLFAQFAQQNINAAVQHLAMVPAGLARENAVRALSDAWVRADLPATLAWANSLSDQTDRATALEVVLSELATKDPLQAIDLAQKSLNGPGLERTVFNALQKLTETDPQGAAGLVRLLPPGEMQTLVAVDIARAFATQNAEAALAWAKTLPTEEVRRLALKRSLEIWANTDPAAAGRYVVAMPAGQDQHDFVVVLAGTLAAANSQNAVAWVQSLPASDTRPAAFAAIADAWAQRDPAAATRWVAQQPPTTLAALAPQTLNAALSYWILKDASAAQEFVRTLPPATQARAAEFVAPLLSQTNPTGTLAWAQALPDTRARTGAIEAAYVRWRDNAPAAAQAWLTTANLTAETRARLQSLQ